MGGGRLELGSQAHLMSLTRLAWGIGTSPEARVQLEHPAPPAPVAQPSFQLQLQPIRAPGVLAVCVFAKEKMASAAPGLPFAWG